MARQTYAPTPAQDKAAAIRARQLRNRRARLAQDELDLQAATLVFVLEHRPHYTRARLGEFVGLSEPRVAQLLAAAREDELAGAAQG